MICYARQILRTLLVVAGALALTACSKTVQWEEEVPLNTGETIWVTREVTYKLKGGGDNPLDLAYRPDWTEKILFIWSGKTYSFKGSALIDVLAISPITRQPVLVAYAGNKQWHWQNNYSCTVPFYVQFNPLESGQGWTWPPHIETWLYGLPYNLMRYRPKWDSSQLKEKYSLAEISQMDGRDLDSKINPSASSDSCFK